MPRLGRPLSDDDPLVCRQKPGYGKGQVSWGNPFKATCNLRRLIEGRADEASLGHVAPHDLRRTVANILHKAKTPEGAHFFDLRDIQRVLGHSRPDTTVKAYMDPIDSETTERAAKFLD